MEAVIIVTKRKSVSGAPRGQEEQMVNQLLEELGVQHKVSMVALVLSWCFERLRAVLFPPKGWGVLEGNLED